MTPDVPVAAVMLLPAQCPGIAAGDDIKRAVARLHEAAADGYSSLFVYDEHRKPVGLLSVRAVLKLFEPEFILTQTWSLPVFWNGHAQDRSRELTGTPVRDVMLPLDAVSVRPTNPLTKAVHLMLRHNMDALPITVEEHLTGILHLHDVFKQIAGLFGPQTA
ncbi:MAG: CBS domain-containing protein [Candidatus Desulforudis sp.]|nr:CBS domain-containing protein [Desulforudis sp.]